MVADCLSWTNGCAQWDIIFYRVFQDWEIDTLTAFLRLLYSVNIQRDMEDNTFWRPTRNRIFEVKSFYKVLFIGGSIFSFPWGSIWKVHVPTKVAFFAWTSALGKILTIDNLCHRNIIIVDWCCMSKQHGESVDHLLLHCIMPSGLWSLVFCLFGVQWVMPQRVVDFLASWKRRFAFPLLISHD